MKKKAPAKKRAAKEPKTKKGAKKTAKKTKKKKDPNAPKRPLSAFMFYSQKHRPLVKKENPEATFADVAKILGEQWKALDESQKEVCIFCFCLVLHAQFLLLYTIYSHFIHRSLINSTQLTKPVLRRRRPLTRRRRARRHPTPRSLRSLMIKLLNKMCNIIANTTCFNSPSPKIALVCRRCLNN